MSWRIDGRKAAIVLVDLQERLAASVAGGETILAKIDCLLEIGKRLSIPIHLTELAPQRFGPISPPVLQKFGNGGPCLARNLLSAVSVLPKDLPQFLLIAGMETHAAVRQTIYDLRERGHAVYVLADAVGSRSAIDHQVALDEMRQDRIVVTTLEAAAYELGGEAQELLWDQLPPSLS